MVVMGIDMGMVDDQMYVGFLEADLGKRGFAEVFSHLLDQPEGEALLFHCTQGKDRTGLVAMLALTALGVDEETIVFDYLLTNAFNAKLIEREQQGLLALGIPAEEIDKYMIGLDRVFPQTMQNALEHLRREYGSVWGYITKELGVGEAERRELCAKYLES
jgi:protein-tyrosine phosphatase